MIQKYTSLAYRVHAYKKSGVLGLLKIKTILSIIIRKSLFQKSSIKNNTQSRCTLNC